MRKIVSVLSLAFFLFACTGGAAASSTEKEISLSDLKDKSITLGNLKPLKLQGQSYDDRAFKTMIRGYAVTSYKYNDNGVDEGSVNEALFGQDPAQTKNFSVGKVEIGFTKRYSNYAWVNAAVEVSQKHENGATVTDTELDVGQINLVAPIGNGLRFSLGKFNSPVSFEQEDDPLKFQSSTSLAFQFASPVKMAGLQVFYPIAINLDVQAIVFNGWNQDGDNNDSKSFALQVGYAPKTWINTRFSYIYGAEQDNNDGDARQVFDAVATLTPFKDFILGLEGAYGRDKNLSTTNPGQDAEWLSGQATIHYDWFKNFGTTVRYSFFDDKDGRPDVQNSQPRTMNEITFAPVFHLSPDFLGYLGWGTISQTQHLLSALDLRFEYRYDWINESNANAFFQNSTGGGESKRNQFVAELVALF